MTDNKIKCEKCFHKSICEKKTCAECLGLYCDDCELYDLYNGVPYIEDCEDFIDADLINRQQSEIERLQNNNMERVDYFSKLREAERKKYENSKRIAETEAIKEFAERVKMAFYYEFDELIPSIMADKIDNIVKEMERETNE